MRSSWRDLKYRWFRRWGFGVDSQAQNELMARLSHELRTSLTGIVGYAEFLEANAAEPMMNFTAKIIRESGLNLARASNSYFDFQYLNSGSINLTSTRFLLAELVGNVLEKNQSMAQDFDVSLFLTCSDDVQSICIKSDIDRQRQVIDAVVFDAIQTSEKWSVIRLSLGVDEHERFLTLSIDTSTSSKNRSEPDLLDQFWNHDNYHYRLQQGPGVELALAKALLEFLGCKVSYQVTSESSTRLVLMFPISEHNLMQDLV